MRSDGNRLSNDSSQDTGGLGFELVGNSNTVEGCTAVGNGTGFLISGSSNKLDGDTAVQAVENGFNACVVNANANQTELSKNTAISSGADGLSSCGSQSKVMNNTAVGNAADGVLVAGTTNVVKGNRAYGNASAGIHVDGSGDTITKNVALGNGTVDLQDANATCDSNTWTNDIFGSASPSSCIH